MSGSGMSGLGMTVPGVYRDRWGIPHIWAGSADDLAYWQGHNVATDRAWQIEVERWRGEGCLAERLGPDELPWDRFARRARLDDTARRCFERLDPPTRRWVTAYVEGVNAALPAGAGAAPEFAATGSAPGRWRPWTPLSVFAVQHILFATFPNKLWRAHVSRTLGAGAVDLFATEGPGGSGSNAWISADGSAPLIAGDPHRLIELPGIYQQVHLACPEFDVIGLAFPGVPGLPHFAHTGGVAWGITNAMADYQDLYREQLRRADGEILVREATRWAPAQVHIEQIKVRGQAPEPVEVIETLRGPIIDFDQHTGDGISLRTPGMVDADLGFNALLPLLRATCVDDVARALAGWVEPVNSVLVADTSGAARRLVAGRVPVRDDHCRHEPVPGWQPQYGWTEFNAPMPAADINGSLVNANDRRPADVAELGVDFAPPHRAERIRELIAAGAEPATVHMDVWLESTVLLGLLDRLDPADLDAAARQVRGRLLDWDRQVRADSVAAGTFAAWRGVLTHRLHDHPFLRPLQDPSGFDELFRPWTDPLARIGYALASVVTGLIARGVDIAPLAAAALADVADGLAPGGATAAWGERHRLHPVRPATDPEIDAAVAATCAAVTLSGDTDCVLATSSTPGVSDACWRGPVARYVWDLADRSNSRWIVPFGASGRPGDPHFDDQLPLWAAGELIPVSTDWRHLTSTSGEQMPAVYAEIIPDVGRLEILPVDPVVHAELLHGWVTQPQSRFWGMATYSVDRVREIYQYLDELDTHFAYLIAVDGTPVGLVQTYEPAHDPVGAHYPVQPGDIGLHLLLAPGTRPGRGFGDAVMPALTRFVFRDPAKDRIVVEPDVRNDRALRRLKLQGFTLGKQIELPDKRAQLAFLSRSSA